MDAPMMMKSLKHVWEIWDIRGLMLISLFLQTFLILLAPLRRTSTNWTVVIRIPLWSAYLLADWTATFAVSLISNNSQNKKSNCNIILQALWAPILLVHLGGPDTITAFSLEDNELWIRHLLSLVTQTAAALYVFFQSLPNNYLWAPTLLMFVSGLIKLSERVRSLYSASLNSFLDSVIGDPDPGLTYAKLVNEYHSKKETNVPMRIVRVPPTSSSSGANKSINRVKEEALSPAEVVLYAHHFFRIFKGLFVDLFFTQRDRNRSRDFFNKRTAEDAFNVVAVELNLVYDVLFTKAGVVYTPIGFYFRSASFACFVATLGLFYCDDKADFHRFDVAITYALLLGGIALDIVSFLFIVHSDWLMIATNKLPDVNIDIMKKAPKSSFRKRWCESVSAFNLIHYCCSSDMKEVFDWRLWFVDHKPFTEALRDHVFKELMMKSEMAEDLQVAKEIIAAKGDWALRFGQGTELLPYFLDMDFNKSLLLLHIATELCYCDEADVEKKNNEYRDFSKLLSDYMMYLLIMQPAMMSPVAGINGQHRFRNTCADAISYLQEEGIILSDVNKTKLNKPKGGSFQLLVYAVYSFFKYLMLYPIWLFVLLPLRCVMYPLSKKPESRKEHIIACNMILDVDTSKVDQVHNKGGRSKSVLFDGCILAKRLKELESLNRVDCKWKLMSSVWVEMLSYAAIHCRPISHVQELSRGGELITIVWLLMVHFGLGNQYQITEDHARAKIIFDK